MNKYKIPTTTFELSKKKGNCFENLLVNPDPKAFAMGQIWSTKQSMIIGDQEFIADEPKILVILESQNHDIGIVTGVPISSELLYAAQYDLLVKGENSPLGFDFMVEVWNETPVYVKQLKKYLGQLSKEFIQKLSDIYSFQLANESIPEHLMKFVGIELFGDDDPRYVFQKNDVRSLMFISQAATYYLSQTLEKTAREAVEESVWEFNLNLIYDKLSKYFSNLESNLAYASNLEDLETFLLVHEGQETQFIIEFILAHEKLMISVLDASSNIIGKRCFLQFPNYQEQIDFIVDTQDELSLDINANLVLDEGEDVYIRIDK